VPLLAPVFDHRVEMMLDSMPVPRDGGERPGPADPRDFVVRPVTDFLRGYGSSVLFGQRRDVAELDELLAGGAAGTLLDAVLGPRRPRCMAEAERALPPIRAGCTALLRCS
jgi:hypothetical protein